MQRSTASTPDQLRKSLRDPKCFSPFCKAESAHSEMPDAWFSAKTIIRSNGGDYPFGIDGTPPSNSSTRRVLGGCEAEG